MNGWSITLESVPADRELLIADLWEAGTTGITEDESFLRAFFDDSADRDQVLRRFSAYHPRFEEQEEHDWVHHARSMWGAFPLGERFWMVPEWSNEPAPDNRLRLPMRPGMASGSGLHPGTQLCLLALEKHVRPDTNVLDIGTGSGILAEAALLLGARAVFGCDIDQQVTAIARANVPRASFFSGSCRSVRRRATGIAVANLNPATIATMARDLSACARTLIVSGFKEDEAARVEKSLGRTANETIELDGWACLIF